MFIDFLIKTFEENKDKDTIVWQDKIYDYQWLLERVHHWQELIKSENIKSGTVSILEADFSPNSVSLFLALIENECILVPLTSSVETKKSEFIEIAQGEVSFAIDKIDNVKVTRLSNTANHELYNQLKQLNHPVKII